MAKNDTIDIAAGMAQVPTNLNLLERLAVQYRVDRAAARRLWPDAELDSVPADAVFYELSLGSAATVLVAHHSHGDGVGVWDVWTGEIYWAQLNRTGEAL